MTDNFRATIDVRTIAPRERHPLIFRTFGDLAAGEALQLVNDHDPKPLYYRQAARQRQVGGSPARCRCPIACRC